MWKIKRTDTFLKQLKRHKKNGQLLLELDKVITRLQDNPRIGGRLSGALHGKTSVRLTQRIRLIFQVDEQNNTVYLIALDHRETIYQ